MTLVINMANKRAVAEARRDGTFYYVGRNPEGVGDWGNRYSHKPSRVPGTVLVESREEAVIMHRADTLNDPELIRRIKSELKDRTLACWCDPLSCHAHTYADIADGRLG